MSKESIQVDCNCSGHVIVGPARDLHLIEGDGAQYWIGGTFYNASHQTLVDAALNGAGQLKDFPLPFALIRRNKDRSVSVATDRYGRVPVYILENGGDIWISTSLKWLAATAGKWFELNEESIGELLTFKFVLGDRTILDGVKRVLPGTIQTLSADGTWKRERYWTPVPPSNRRRLDTELETLSRLFADGVRRCVDGVDNIAVTLSGGLDSRAILAATLKAGSTVSTLTTGIAGGMDHRYAEMAAKTANVPLTLALLDSDYRSRFFDYSRESLDIYEGMLLTTGTEVLWMIEAASDVPIQLVLHGALGELAKGATANHFEVSQSELASCRKDVAALLSGRYEAAHRRMLSLLKAPVRQRLQGLALQNLRDSAKSLASEMPPLDVPFAMQVVEHFRNSGVYSAGLWGQHYPIMFPFADPQYVDHLLTIRPEDRIGSKFHYELLRRLHDGLYRCPESNSGVAPSASPVLRMASKFGVRVMNKLGMKSAAGHVDFSAWMNAMQPSIEDVLLKNSYLCDTYWDGDQLKKCIEQTRQGDQSSASDLYRLLCLEFIHQMFNGK